MNLIWPLNETCDLCEKPATFITQWTEGGHIEKKCAEHGPNIQSMNLSGPMPYYSLIVPLPFTSVSSSDSIYKESQ